MATSEEVARLAGVSRATVSRVLNGSSHVSETTKKRIYEAVAALGYGANALGSAQRSGLVALTLFGKENGLNLSQITNTEFYFFLEILRHLEYELASAGYDLFLPTRSYNPTNVSENPEIGYMLTLQNRGIEGVITIALNTNDSRIPMLCRSTIPTVFIDSLFQGEHATYVKSDYLDGAQQATEHLLQLGHKRIAFFVGDLFSNTGTERLMGQQQSMARAGLVMDPQLICQTAWNTRDAYQTMKSLLHERRDFTAVVASSDMLAFGILEALKEEHIRVPEDVSVVGFDDIDLSETSDPPLTTVRQDKKRIGKGTVDTLIQLIQGNKAPVPLIIPTQLIVRNSTGPARLDK
ncbi:LacI family DNA-binding transcriptional regulator [Dictyobacter arantiisoli]|uniref:LacI family transcriptional regulator n=1 Tax=Dictyobacter arantiisoli TaxID=2014874 RepID=A0A5A5TI04_9CHLR|nr:LacI family DNA-binding transcriptional regulator [Dictyobacter arantiisoli]GCF10604.1 LacI family transcriptional regulator [Dictyobacter arantiisoli]